LPLLFRRESVKRQIESIQKLSQLVGGELFMTIVAGEAFGFQVRKDGRMWDVWIHSDGAAREPGYVTVEPAGTKGTPYG